MIPQISIGLLICEDGGGENMWKEVGLLQGRMSFPLMGGEGYVEKEQIETKSNFHSAAPYSIKNDQTTGCLLVLALSTVLIVQAGGPWGPQHLFLTHDITL